MELQEIKKELENIKVRKTVLQTFIDQANEKCRAIEQKYGIKTQEELEQLLKQEEIKLNTAVEDAEKYLNETSQILAEYESLIK